MPTTSSLRPGPKSGRRPPASPSACRNRRASGSPGRSPLTETVRLVKEFGFYPDPLRVEAGRVTIGTHPDLERIASDVLASGGIEKDWIYAPLQRIRNLMNGQVRSAHTRLAYFGLPKTHSIDT